ncbi:hypothetical protein CLLI_08350 [Clostridium liquoris]|uniref:GtrA/DPMS transmembrane domain-containing protein n=1 Tax=Clostridium liquoris TaxID=1289519 RepID=A0A2T0B650_9CLOT|nr:GtrA family protein [Clostridium liquoris]PRR79355.1 hypothetical protein CLLI_08350 [Clostridium liquoris]
MHNKNIKQFILYAIIGGSNFFIEFFILNILWKITGLYSGYINFLFKGIAFIAYSINGYYWNKKYTFKTEGSYVSYASVLGAASIVDAFILSNLSLHNLLGVSQVLWSNISALTASITTGVASFLINKFAVFKN